MQGVSPGIWGRTPPGIGQLPKGVWRQLGVAGMASVLSEQPPTAEQAADYRPQTHTGTPAINTSETTKLYSWHI